MRVSQVRLFQGLIAYLGCPFHNELRRIVLEKLRLKWSPEQIAGWLSLQKTAQISHETIYRFLRSHPRFQHHLRHGAKRYRKRACGLTGPIANRVDIGERPDIVETKSRIGDWELDSIVGKGHAVIVTMVERASKYTRLRKAPNSKSKTMGLAICKALKSRKLLTLTLTADNGGEFAAHQYVARRLGADFTFAKRYHARQRGLNEQH